MARVVIVGAGPTGLTLAMLLAQRGVSVKLVESSPSFRRIFRGEALMPSGLSAIEQMGLTDLVENIPHRPIDAWEFYIENRPIFRVDEPMEAGGQPCTLISQPAFLAAVLARASEYANFELIQGAAMRDLLRQDQRVAGVRLSDGREFEANLVIGADGRNSIVRQQANLKLKQAAQSFDILWFKLPTNPAFQPENVFTSVLRGQDAFGVFQGSEGNLQVGWSLQRDNPISARDGSAKNWQQVDWVEKIAAAAPDWLASHVREQRESIERPLLLSIIVGRCPHWHQPGVLLLGDAAHPMSPIRAQGINMALRDAIVTTNHLVPVLQQPLNLTAIDAALAQIQNEREPEIIEIQRLQQAEVVQAKLMHNYPIVRHAVSRLAPIIGSRIRASWLDRQLQLRRGFTQVNLVV
jgi:2-polyprenyl-6-methoxyphenol hydroxylase-like FAD-dependent oxidoreductase